MGEANNVFRVFMSKSERIRSVLEYYLKEKLPDDWRCEEADGFYAVRNVKGKMSHRQRDHFKRIISSKGSYRLGLENQEDWNLIFPWRLQQMDTLDYERQIEEIQQRNVAQKVHYGEADDYKYKYLHTDKLEPVINLTLYWGKQKWRSPRSLGEMMDGAVLTGKTKRLFQDYRINLVNMRAIPSKALEEMDSDLKYVLGLMKCDGSRKKYEAYIMAHQEYFRHLPKSAADVLAVCLKIYDIGSYFEYKDGEEEEEVDMCKAVEDMKKDAMRRGIREGKREGKREGRIEGKLEGAQLGMERVNQLIELLFRDGRLEDLKRSATDSLFQKQLFGEYHI